MVFWPSLEYQVYGNDPKRGVGVGREWEMVQKLGSLAYFLLHSKLELALQADWLSWAATIFSPHGTKKKQKKKTFCEKTMFISMEYNPRGRGNILESRFQLRRGWDQPAHLCPSVKYFRDTRHWAALFTAHYQQQPEEIRENLSGRGVLFTTSH